MNGWVGNSCVYVGACDRVGVYVEEGCLDDRLWKQNRFQVDREGRDGSVFVFTLFFIFLFLRMYLYICVIMKKVSISICDF